MSGFWRWCVYMAALGLAALPAARAQDEAAAAELAARAQVYYDRMLPLGTGESDYTALVLNKETGLILMPTNVVASLTPIRIVPPAGEALAQYLFTTRHTESTPPMLCATTPEFAADALIADLRDVPVSEGVKDGDTAYLLSMDVAADGSRRGHCEAVTVTKMRHEYPQIRRQVVVFNTVNHSRHVGGVLMDAAGALLGIVFEEPTDVLNLGYAAPVLLPEGLATAAAEGEEIAREPEEPALLHEAIADYDWYPVARNTSLSIARRERLANQNWPATEFAIEHGPLYVAHDPENAQTWFDLAWRLYAVWSLSPPNLSQLKPRIRLCLEESMRLNPELTPLAYGAMATILATDGDMPAARAMATTGTTRWPGAAPMCYRILALIDEAELAKRTAKAAKETTTDDEPTETAAADDKPDPEATREIDPVTTAFYHERYMQAVPADGPETWWAEHWARLEALEPAQLTDLIGRLRAEAAPVATSPAERVAAARRAIATPGGWLTWDALPTLAADPVATGRSGLPIAIVDATELPLRDVRQLLLDDGGEALYAVSGSRVVTKLDARRHEALGSLELPADLGALVLAGPVLAGLDKGAGLIRTWQLADLSVGPTYTLPEFAAELESITASTRAGMIGVTAQVGRDSRSGLLDVTRPEAFTIPAPIHGWPATPRLWLEPESLATRSTLTDLYTSASVRITSRTAGDLPILPEAQRRWPQYFARDIQRRFRDNPPLYADGERGLAIELRTAHGQLTVAVADLASGRAQWQLQAPTRPGDLHALAPATARLYSYGADRPLRMIQLGEVRRDAGEKTLRIGSPDNLIFPQEVRIGVPIVVHVAAPVAGTTFALEDAPAGVTIAADGTVTWTPNVTQLGLYAITVVTRTANQEERRKWLVRIAF